MLGFVSEGPSPQLQACKTSRVSIMFNYFWCKGTENFLISSGILPESYKKMHPTKIECKITAFF